MKLVEERTFTIHISKSEAHEICDNLEDFELDVEDYPLIAKLLDLLVAQIKRR
jgi:hypothetical protein